MITIINFIKDIVKHTIFILKKFFTSKWGVAIISYISILAVVYSNVSPIVQQNDFTFYELCFSRVKYWWYNTSESQEITVTEDSLSFKRYHFLFMIDESGSIDNVIPKDSKLKESNEKLKDKYEKENKRLVSFFINKLDEENSLSNNLYFKSENSKKVETLPRKLLFHILSRLDKGFSLDEKDPYVRYFDIALLGGKQQIDFPLSKNGNYWQHLTNDKIRKAKEVLAEKVFKGDTTNITKWFEGVIDQYFNNKYTNNLTINNSNLIIIFISDFYDEENPYFKILEERFNEFQKKEFKYQIKFVKLPSVNTERSNKVISTLKNLSNLEAVNEQDWFYDMVINTSGRDSIYIKTIVESIALPYVETQNNKPFVFYYDDKVTVKYNLDINLGTGNHIVNFKSLDEDNLNNLFYNYDSSDSMSNLVNLKSVLNRSVVIEGNKLILTLDNSKKRFKIPENLWIEISQIDEDKSYKVFKPIVFQRMIPINYVTIAVIFWFLLLYSFGSFFYKTYTKAKQVFNCNSFFIIIHFFWTLFFIYVSYKIFD